MDVNGTVAEGFEPVREAFVGNFETLGDRGAALAVYRDGHRVVDLWAGTRDVDGTEPWRRGTAQIVRSATKGVAAAVPLLLHQRGLLDLDAPVGEYWPEFKARGKERVLVRHVLNHRSRPPRPGPSTHARGGAEPGTGRRGGRRPVPRLGARHRPRLPRADVRLDAGRTGAARDRTVGRMSGSRPRSPDRWAPTCGWACRKPRKPCGRTGRVGSLETPEPATGAALRVRPKRAVTEAYADPDSLTRRAFAAITPFPDQNAPAYRAAALPATNGIATADGLARVYAALIGEVDGVRLFDPATVELARAEESAGPDRVLVVGTRFGLGYMLHGTASPLLGPGSFGHPGRGGSLGFADPETGIALGYVTNGFRKTVTADPRAQALVRAVRSVVVGQQRP